MGKRKAIKKVHRMLNSKYLEIPKTNLTSFSPEEMMEMMNILSNEMYTPSKEEAKRKEENGGKYSILAGLEPIKVEYGFVLEGEKGQIQDICDYIKKEFDNSELIVTNSFCRRVKDE